MFKNGLFLWVAIFLFGAQTSQAVVPLTMSTLEGSNGTYEALLTPARGTHEGAYVLTIEAIKPDELGDIVAVLAGNAQAELKMLNSSMVFNPGEQTFIAYLTPEEIKQYTVLAVVTWSASGDYLKEDPQKMSASRMPEPSLALPAKKILAPAKEDKTVFKKEGTLGKFEIEVVANESDEPKIYDVRLKTIEMEKPEAIYVHMGRIEPSGTFKMLGEKRIPKVGETVVLGHVDQLEFDLADYISICPKENHLEIKESRCLLIQIDEGK